MLLQRAACGVMLAQAWRYGNELLRRGDAESFFLAAAGLLLGLLLAFSTYQAASRSSLWISCMLSGGLVGLGHLRSVGGRTSEDAVIVTAFMFSCVLGCALPQVMWHACLSHGSEALMTFVLAVLVTEAVSSWETMPLDLSKVLISIFLLTTGFYGLFHGSGASQPSHVTYETPISEPRVEERGGEKTEKRGGERPGKDYTAFFPASVVESRKYSPHFLLGHRARLRRGSGGTPSGSPLLKLQPRQAETAGPSRKAGKAADNKRREKISNRTPVPFEPQETRPKVPDTDEQDANEENDASALLKGDPIEAVLLEGPDVTVEDHDDVAAPAESVETSKKDPEVLPLQTMDVATPEILEALPLSREFEAPKNLNVLAAEFVPPEVTVTQTALGFDAPSSDSYDMPVESTGATGYDMSYGEVQGGMGSMASYNTLEGADFTGFDVPSFDGGFDGMDQPFMEADVGYGAANGSFAEYQSWGNGTSQGPYMPQVYGEASSWSDSFETYDGYAYGSEAYDSYGYPVEEPGWNETAWDETAPYAGDGHLHEVSQPRRRSWENPTLIEDKEDSDGAWGPVAAPLAQLPDPGLGRASVARKNNEKGRGKERKGHSISATSMGKNGPFTGTGTSSEPKGGKGEKGKKGGRGKGKEASETQGDALWAYVDPRGKIQSGFSSAKMRSWFESGYFKEHLEVAQVKDGQVPPRRAFQPLSQLFGSAERCFL